MSCAPHHSDPAREAVREMYQRWQDGYAFNEDSDYDVALAERVDVELSVSPAPAASGGPEAVRVAFEAWVTATPHPRCDLSRGTGGVFGTGYTDVRTALAWNAWKAAALAAPAATGGEGRPEDQAETFIQAAVDSAPEPLRRLGEWLAHKLDDDDWKTADRLITGAAVSCASIAAELDQAVGVIKDRNAALTHPAPSETGASVGVKLPRLTEAMIKAACKAHYGSDEIDGIAMTVAGTDWNFREAFKRMWSGARAALEVRSDG